MAYLLNADFFTVELAKQIASEEGEADITFARNVIPHVKEIHSVIEGNVHSSKR
jgi:hypothetical protein